MWTSVVRSLTDSTFKMSVFRRNIYRSKDAITENKSCHTCSATDGEFLRLWTCVVWSNAYCATHVTLSVTVMAQHYSRNFRRIMKFCRHENCGAVFCDVGSYSWQIRTTVPKGDLWPALSERGKVKLPGVVSQTTAIQIGTAIRNARHKCAVHFLSSCTECKAIVLKVQYYRANPCNIRFKKC